MVDPHDALVSYQHALTGGIISPTPGSLHEDLVELMDDANGMLRITYAVVEAGVVKATVIYLVVETLHGEPCFQVGYAVALPFRGKGLATSILSKSIEEMQHRFKHRMKKFYVEAVVSVDMRRRSELRSERSQCIQARSSIRTPASVPCSS